MHREVFAGSVLWHTDGNNNFSYGFILKNDILSGGERRKASIDVAFKKSVKVLIMDEPDNNLDGNSINMLIEKILCNKDERITLIISHDERLIKISDEVIHF